MEGENEETSQKKTDPVVKEGEGNVDYEKGECIGAGGNSHCYEVKGKPEIVMLDINSTGFGDYQETSYLHRQNLKKKLEDLPDNVNVAKILELKLEGSNLTAIMEKAKGEPVHKRGETGYDTWSNRLTEIAEIPQAHYDKLLADLNALNKHNILFDPSKPDNLFYDKEKGFTFIDLSLGEGYKGSLIAPIIFTYNFFKFGYEDKLNHKDGENIEKIIKKLENAGDTRDENEIANITEIRKFISKLSSS